MARHASWVHGTAFQPAERPAGGLTNVDGVAWTDLVGLRQGWGSTWQGQPNRSNWFHVSIPTPVIVNDVRIRLVTIFVMFRCGDPDARIAANAGASITDIHVWDGPHRIRTFSGFNLFGDHLTRFDTSTTHTLPSPQPLAFGLGISVHVRFSAAQTVTFASAGADFNV
jgi:hypothetical protein